VMFNKRGLSNDGPRLCVHGDTDHDPQLEYPEFCGFRDHPC
jgi:hypothetical protein